MNAQAIHYIPLDQLSLSPHNARKTGGKNIADLVASIPANGLLQNLIVEQVAVDRWEVVAGGRRLRALKFLKERGELPIDLEEVPCKLASNGSVTEVSTTENVIREDMHPADQFDAFKQMVADGKPIEDIAAHFGVSDLVVKQRLRLASLSPKLLDVFREDKATLAQMIALSITENHSQQEKVWAAAIQEWERQPQRLRDAIVGKKLKASTGVAAFVGIKEYELAGGAVVRDLFGEQAYFADPGLTDRLALKKLQEKADELKAEGWSWAEARVRFPWEDRNRFGEVRGQYRGNKEVFSAEAKTRAGVVVSIDDDGKIKIHAGLLKPGQKANNIKSKAETRGKKKTAPGAVPGLSIAAQSLLAGFRTAVVRLELATQPRVMLAVLAADLASRYLDKAPSSTHVVMLDRDHRYNGMQDFRKGVEEAAATKTRSAGDRDVSALLRKDAGKKPLLQWLLEQPEETTHELLAAVAAGFINLDLDKGDAFAGQVGIDFAQHWKIGESWLATLQKSTIIGIVREVHGKAMDTALQALNRADAAKRAAELLAGSGWLPKPLRGPDYAIKAVATTTETQPAKTPAMAAKKTGRKTKPVAKKAPAKKATAPVVKKATKKATPKPLMVPAASA